MRQFEAVADHPALKRVIRLFTSLRAGGAADLGPTCALAPRPIELIDSR